MDEEFDWNVDWALGECYPGREITRSNVVFNQGLSSLGLPVPSESRNYSMPLSSATSYGPPQAAFPVPPPCHLERRIWGYDPREKGTQVTAREIDESHRQFNYKGSGNSTSSESSPYGVWGDGSREKATQTTTQNFDGRHQLNTLVSNAVLPFKFTLLPPELRYMILSECVRSARICPRCNITHKIKVTTRNGMRLWGIGPMPVIFCCNRGIYDALVKMIYGQVSEARITGHAMRHQYIGGIPFDIREVHPKVGQYVTNVRIALKHEYPVPFGDHWEPSVSSGNQEKPCSILALANHIDHYQNLKTVRLRVELLSKKIPSSAFENMNAFNKPEIVFQLELAPTIFSKKTSTVCAAKKVSKKLGKDVKEQWDAADYDKPMILSPFVQEPKKKKENIRRRRGAKEI